MQHIRAVYVDAQTKIPATKAHTKNGPILPVDMDIAWKETTKRPTLVYGTTSDDTDTNVHGVEVLSQEEFDKYKQWYINKEKKRLMHVVEVERSRREHLMPFTVPGGAEISVNVGEEPQKYKMRQTWLSGKASKGESRLRRGKDMDNEEYDQKLIAADNTKHDMDASAWLDLGEKLDKWISQHVLVAHEHQMNIMALSTLDEVQSYDYTTMWP